MVNPLVVGLQAVRLVGDVLHIQAEAVEELAFKKLPAEKYDECEISNGVRAETEKRAFRGGSQWYERQPVIKRRSRSKFSLGINAGEIVCNQNDRKCFEGKGGNVLIQNKCTIIKGFVSAFSPTWTPRMPKIMKKAQQMRTMLPMGLRDVMSVSTTSFRPGALLITLKRKVVGG